MILDDNFYLDLAIDEAWKFQGLTYPNPAVGSLVRGENGEILSIEAHREAGSPHAEVLAIQRAYFKLTGDTKILKLTSSSEIHDYLINNSNNLFIKSQIYVSLEPCNHFGKTPPCSILIKKLNFKRVIIGIRDFNNIASGGIETIKFAGIETIVLNSQKAKDLIEPFYFWSQKNKFSLFKMAQTINGNIKGGTISSLNSRTHVHAIRNKINFLAIGGETVRTDKPILDSRLVNGKAPNILIISREKNLDNFDKNISLFKINNRTVEVVDIDDLKKINGFILFEGGFELLKNIYFEIDWLLLYISSNISNREALQDLDKFGFLPIYSKIIDNDIIIWLRRI